MSVSLVHDDPVYIDCARCDGRGFIYVQHSAYGGGTDYCGDCGGSGEDWIDLSELSTLAHNLSIAAGLCAAFAQGSEYRMRMMLSLPADEDWRPGCQRPSP